MQLHNSSCLTGPISQHRAWWQTVNGKPIQDDVANRDCGEDQSPEEPFRADLVARIRREIADGTYGTEEQWEVALDRLLEHLDRG